MNEHYNLYNTYSVVTLFLWQLDTGTCLNVGHVSVILHVLGISRLEI